MRQIRVTGLVRDANRLRRALASPMTPAQQADLADWLHRSLADIEAILRRHSATPDHLPPPSRRAYAFLKQADLDRATLVDPSSQPASGNGRRAESVSYRGLRAFLDHLLDDIAAAIEAGTFRGEATLKVIAATADRLDHVAGRDALQPEHLTPESREMAGWFRYFADDRTLTRYADAVRTMQSVLAELPAVRARWSAPVRVHFRPSSYIYKCRDLLPGTRVTLCTPMIVWDRATLERLGKFLLGHKRYWRTVTEAMLAEPFQAVAAELEALAGRVEHTRGAAYDLADVFERVNRAHFAGSVPRPKLTWSRTLSGTKFGHYDFVHDQVSISASLDRPEVPDFVIDHVMHHELLHKEHGFRWQRSRQHSHTREFRAAEQRFPRYEEAARFLERFAAAR